jgi:hypothetical protein
MHFSQIHDGSTITVYGYRLGPVHIPIHMSALFYLFGGNPEKITKDAIRESRRATSKIEIELRVLSRERTRLEARASDAMANNRKPEALLIARQIISLNARSDAMIQSTIHLGQVSAQSAAVLSSQNTLKAVAKTAKAAERADRLFDNSSVVKDVKRLQAVKMNSEKKQAQVDDVFAVAAEDAADRHENCDDDDDDDDDYFGNTPEGRILRELPGGRSDQLKHLPSPPTSKPVSRRRTPISDSLVQNH